MDLVCNLPDSGGSVGATLLIGALAIVVGACALAAQRRIPGGRAAPLVLLAVLGVAVIAGFASDAAAAPPTTDPTASSSPTSTCIPPPSTTAPIARVELDNNLVEHVDVDVDH